MTPTPATTADQGPSPSRAQVIGGFLTCALMVLAGLAMVWFGAGMVGEGLAAKKRPTTTGTVIGSEVFRTRASKIGEENTSGGRFQAVLTYRYSVAGEEYESDRIAAGPAMRHDSESDGQAYLDSLAGPDGAVTVYFDPANPADAMLTPGVPTSGILLVVVGLCLALLAGSGAAVYVLSQRKQRPATEPGDHSQ